MFEALDIVRTNFSYEMMTVISVERGCTPNKYYCIDGNGNGDWFGENELKMATTKDFLTKNKANGKGSKE